jgi:alkylation response protein AidB-like acyl-CoA dehydrogenase
MAFSFTDEQEQFRDIVARFCRDKSPTTAVRAQMETERGYDPAVWEQLCQELGLAAIHIPEHKGGSGFGPVELGIVMEEMGRSLLCSPYFASAVLTATAIAEVGTDVQCEQLIPSITNGSTIGALAISDSDGGFSTDRLTTIATPNDDAYTLNGAKRFVVDGRNADLLVVAAATESGPALFTVAADAGGLDRTPTAVMDPTRKLADITFTNTPAQRLGGGEALDLTPVYNTALIALANEMAGGAQALFDSAVEYTKLRVQFGRTIGSFQAIKHRLADLLLEVEGAKSAAYQAAQAMAADEAVTQSASLAKACAAEAYLSAAIQCIQLHGGIGFTWENDTHLWFKRAKSSEVFLGTPAHHRERMLQAMGV